METLDVSSEPEEESDAFKRLTWPRTLVLHLTPAAVTAAGALALAPLMPSLGLPPAFALTIAFAVLLTPVELGLLLRAAHNATGRWSLRALPAVLAYRRPLRRWALLVPALFGLAVIISVVLTPISDAAGDRLSGVFPDWSLPGHDSTAGFPTAVLVGTLLATLAIDGLINPAVEELYFRAYLLPRLPGPTSLAVPLSAGLFTVQHYWQPYNWILIFVLQLILTLLVRRLRSIRLGIAMHVTTNCFGIIVTLIGVLA